MTTENGPGAVVVSAPRHPGAKLLIHDPYVAESARDVLEIARECQGLVPAVGHVDYHSTRCTPIGVGPEAEVMVDGRHVLSKPTLGGDNTLYRGEGERPGAI